MSRLPPHITPLLLGLLAGTAGAQLKTFVVPSANKTTAGTSGFNDIPFGRASIRYQQVYKAFDIKKSVGPVRIHGIRFRGSSFGSGQTGYSVLLEVTLGLLAGNASNTFSQNLGKPSVVFSKKNLSLGRNSTAWHINIPFDTGKTYVWDGASHLVIDMKIFGNGNRNRNFVYWVDSTVTDSSVQRLFSTKGPTVTTADMNQTRNGLITQFDYSEGVTLNFGQGCKGLGGYVPKSSTNIVPLVGSPNLKVQVTQAPPQAPAILLWGASNTKAGSIPLPLDLRSAGMPGCFLLVDPVIIWGTVTIGGNPGTGLGSLPFLIPAMGSLRGTQLYFQWAILDKSQGRTIPLTWSNGLHMIIG